MVGQVGPWFSGKLDAYETQPEPSSAQLHVGEGVGVHEH